jgi:hypothetical protein
LTSPLALFVWRFGKFVEIRRFVVAGLNYRILYYFWQWQLINYWDDCHLELIPLLLLGRLPLGINSKAKLCHGNELPENL